MQITTIDELDPVLVAELQDEFSQLVQERHPEIETIRGVFHDLVSYFAGGISGAINQTELNRLRRSMSLKAIEEDPVLAVDDFVDAVLSNYMVTRNQGSSATGEVAIVVSEDTTIVVPGGLVFDAGGATFQVDRAYIARPVGETATNLSERVLQPLGDGTFSFTVNAVATSTGIIGNILRGTQLTPSPPPDNYVTSYAATDFSGGTDVESNADLLARLRLGIAARVMQGRSNIRALIKAQPLFANTLDYSIVGYGNPEMTRDQHGIFPISSGGRVDIYARTAPLPRTVVMVKEATYVAASPDGGIWQFTIEKTDAPGFYDVSQIILLTDPANTTGFEIVADVRGCDLPTDQYAPDIVTNVEGIYTAYQTAVIQFIDTATDHTGLTTGLSKQDYSVAVRVMPLIAELQEFCNRADIRNLSADVLVKAAIPCTLTINLEIQVGAETASPDLSEIKAAITSAVNNLGFTGQLHASLIHDVVHGYLQRRQAVGSIDLHGRIRRPSGQIHTIRAKDVLRVPDDPGNLVTGNTTIFILDVSNIGISTVATGYTAEV